MTSPFCIENKVVIVTGAARGHGLSLAKGLLSLGAKVLMVDILEEPTLPPAQLAEGSVCFLKNDLSQHQEISQITKNVFLFLEKLMP